MPEQPIPADAVAPDAVAPDSINLAVVGGVLSSDPRRRSLPSGSELVSYEVTTTDPDGTRRTVPVVWFDPRRAPRLAEGHTVLAVGSIRRRFFRAGGATASRTELEARVVARVGSTRADRALEDARTTLGRCGPFG